MSEKVTITQLEDKATELANLFKDAYMTRMQTIIEMDGNSYKVEIKKLSKSQLKRLEEEDKW